MSVNNAPKDFEEKLFEIVGLEMQSGFLDNGTWTRALAESEGSREKAEARYIQLRVSKLGEKAIEDHRQKMNETSEKQKDSEAIIIVKTIAKRNSFRFKLFSIALFLIGSAILFISALTYLGDGRNVNLFFITLISGVTITLLSVVAFIDSNKIEKINNIDVLHRKMKRLFLIIIPTSFIVSAIGLTTVILALFAFIAFVKIAKDADDFSNAYKRVKERNLIEKV